MPLRRVAGRVAGRVAAHGAPFARMLVADGLSLLALMTGHVALAWWIAEAGGARDLAAFGAVVALVGFVALPLLSPLGDRWPKRSVIAVALVLLAGRALLLAVLAQAGLYLLDAIIALEIVGALAMALLMPALMSVVADLLPAESMTAGLGAQKSVQSIGRLVGPALGGLLLGAAGTAAALWLSAALLVLAGALAAGVRIAPHPTPERATVARWAADLRAGLAAKWHIPMERGWTFVSFTVMVFFAPGIGMLVPLKVQSLGLGGGWLGACEALLSAGMLVGALGGSSALARRVGRFPANFGAVLCEGLALLVVGLTSQPLVLVAAFAAFGFCIATVQTIGQTHRLLAMPPGFRARMTAVNLMAMQVSYMVGPALAGLLLARWPIGTVYLVFGAGLFAAALGYTQVPGYRRFLGLTHDEATGHYARQHPELFGAARP